jgi:Na+-driven multidrug efflux pump
MSLEAPLNDDPPPESPNPDPPHNNPPPSPSPPPPPPPDHSKSDNAAEHLRLGSHRALPTLRLLSIGPLISNFIGSAYGVVTSIWIDMAMGTTGIAGMTTFGNLESCAAGFGHLLSAAACSKISSLLGQDCAHEASQLLCDLFRLSFIFGIISPALFIPLCTPLGKWFGASAEAIKEGRDFLSIMLGFNFIPCCFALFSGSLLGEGRGVLVGGLHIASFLSNMVGFMPLFLVVFKWGMFGAAAGRLLSQFIPVVIVFIIYSRGKFGVKFPLSGLLKGFSKHTLPALRVGLSEFVIGLTTTVSGIVIRKYMGLCAEHNPEITFDDAITGFNTVGRILGLSLAVPLGVAIALMPSLSYAYSARRPNRAFALIGHTSWISGGYSVAATILIYVFARPLAMIISKSNRYLRVATPMLIIANWETPYAWMRVVMQIVLQALQYGTSAAVYSFFSMVLFLAVVSVLYVTGPNDSIRLMYSMPITAAAGVVLGLILVIFPVKKLWKDRQEMKRKAEQSNLEGSTDQGISQ